MGLRLCKPKGLKNYYAVGSVGGWKVRKSLGTDNNKIAKELRAHLEAKLFREMMDGETRGMTFREAAELYLRDKPNARFVDPLVAHFKDKRLADFTPLCVRNAADELLPGRKASTKNRQVLGVTSAIINHAAMLTGSRHIRIQKFSVEKPQRRTASPEWIIKFQTASHARGLPHLAALCAFMVETGARLGEVTRLKRADFDFEHCVANLGITKNGEYQSALISKALTCEIARLDHARPYVFGYEGNSGVHGIWRKICDDAGIEYIPPHQAGRHSMATLLNNSGWTSNDIARAGRWKSPRMVQDVYIHADEKGREAAELIRSALEEVLKGLSDPE